MLTMHTGLGFTASERLVIFTPRWRAYLVLHACRESTGKEESDSGWRRMRAGPGTAPEVLLSQPSGCTTSFKIDNALRHFGTNPVQDS